MLKTVIRFGLSSLRGAAYGAVLAALYEGLSPSVFALRLRSAVKKAGYVPGEIAVGEGGYPQAIVTRSPRGNEVIITVEEGGYSLTTHKGETLSAPSLRGVTSTLVGLG